MNDRLLSLLAEAEAAAGTRPATAARLAALSKLLRDPPAEVDALACVARALPALTVPALVSRSSAYAAALTAIRAELDALDVAGPPDLGAGAWLLIEALDDFRTARAQVSEAARGDAATVRRVELARAADLDALNVDAPALAAAERARRDARRRLHLAAEALA